MLLGKLGYKVVAVTGKPEHEAQLRQWGASCIIGREELLSPADKPLLSVQYAGGVPLAWWGAADLPSERIAQYTVAINLSGFIAVALLAGSLAEGLRSAGARLKDASHEIADLRAFNEYVIDLGGLLIIGGRLADLLGAKKMFATGGSGRTAG